MPRLAQSLSWSTYNNGRLQVSTPLLSNLLDFHHLGPELHRNGRFYVRPKSGFWPKKSPKMTFPPLIIWAKALFFFEQLFPVVARTWLESKSDSLFLGPKFRFLAQKSDFWTQNRNFGPKKRHTLLDSNHVLATTGKSCSKKKGPFAQIIKGENVILGDFLG